ATPGSSSWPTTPICSSTAARRRARDARPSRTSGSLISGSSRGGREDLADGSAAENASCRDSSCVRRNGGGGRMGGGVAAGGGGRGCSNRVDLHSDRDESGE